jgi:hypothetical protein
MARGFFVTRHMPSQSDEERPHRSGRKRPARIMKPPEGGCGCIDRILSGIHGACRLKVGRLRPGMVKPLGIFAGWLCPATFSKRIRLPYRPSWACGQSTPFCGLRNGYLVYPTHKRPRDRCTRSRGRSIGEGAEAQLVLNVAAKLGADACVPAAVGMGSLGP